MIELERHIEILLLSNDCVIVPDFGGFMAHHADARFDERDNMFIPPLRTIGFNPKLKMNDSLLAQSYVEAYDISYPEALKRIADEVREIKEYIESEGEFELHNIGTISINEDGHYEFEPCEAGILTPELYGLDSFGFDLLDTQDKKGEECKADIVDIDSSVGEEKEEKTISIRISLLRNIAVACIAIVAFLLLPTPLDPNTTTIAGRGVDTRLLNKIMPREVTTGTSAIDEIDFKKSYDSIVAAKECQNATIQEASHTKDNFVIVIASKVTRKNAEAYVEKLKQKGLAEARVVTRPNDTKIVFGNYASRQEAHEAMDKLNHNETFADSWIMKMD